MNADKLHNIVAWLCLPSIGVIAFIGGEYGIDVATKLFLKLLGIYLLFYCFKCIKSGKENFITISWSSDVVTKDGEPFLFWLAMGLLFFLSVAFLLN